MVGRSTTNQILLLFAEFLSVHHGKSPFQCLSESMSLALKKGQIPIIHCIPMISQGISMVIHIFPASMFSLFSGSNPDHHSSFIT